MRIRVIKPNYWTEKDVLIVKGRIVKLFLAVIMILSLLAGSALAVTDGLQVVDVIQNGAEVTVYLTQSNSSGISSDVYQRENYTVQVGDDALMPEQAQSLSLANVQIDYTLLYDGTLTEDQASKVDTGILRFAGNMDNERLRVAYYKEELYMTQGFVDSAAGLGTSASISTKLRAVYDGKTEKSQHTPDLNQALSQILDDIGQATNNPSMGLRNVIVVITDTDAPSFSNAVNEKVARFHVPVYVIMLGGSSANAGRYAAQSGGQVYKSSISASDIDRNLTNVRDTQKNMVILKVFPSYDTFMKGEVNLSVTLQTAISKITSQAFATKLDVSTVPFTPTPSPVPVTLPPDRTATPEPTASPSPTPSPSPSPTPKPTPTPYVEVTEIPTTPPTATPSPSPTPYIAPTATPEPNWIEDTFGADGIWILGAGALFLVALIILMVIFISSKKKKKKSENSLRLSSNSSSMDDVTMTTPNIHHGGDDLDATTYGNKPPLDATQGGDYRDDLDKTTSPFAPKPTDESMIFTPAFGTVSSESTVSDGVLEIDEEDENDKTVAMTSEEDENEKTVRMEDEMGLNLHLTVDYQGRIKDSEPAHQEIDSFVRKKLTIGRGTDCDVCLKYDTVSKHHLEITYGPDGLFARDLNSSNGTKLNGEKITDQVPLKNQDELMLGFCKVKIELSL